MFVVTHVLPANPAQVAAGPGATKAQVAIVAHRMGLDKPLVTQYVSYVEGLVRLDLGTSLTSGEPISDELEASLPVTIEFVAMSVILMILIAIPFGLIAAVVKKRWMDALIRFIALVGTGIAPFWLAIILQLIFYQGLHILPVGGQIDPTLAPPAHITGMYIVDSALSGNWRDLGSSLQHAILPVVALTLGQLGILVRIVRVQTLAVLRNDYVRTARAKGLGETAVLFRHVLRNAWNPILTQLGVQSGYLLTGAVFVEAIYRLPGLGLYTMNAVGNLDFTALTGVALFLSVMFIVINFIVDLLYSILDPRVQV
jgi:peptide/nickel transport system permease protein